MRTLQPSGQALCPKGPASAFIDIGPTQDLHALRLKSLLPRCVLQESVPLGDPIAPVLLGLPMLVASLQEAPVLGQLLLATPLPHLTGVLGLQSHVEQKITLHWFGSNCFMVCAESATHSQKVKEVGTCSSGLWKAPRRAQEQMQTNICAASILRSSENPGMFLFVCFRLEASHGGPCTARLSLSNSKG